MAIADTHSRPYRSTGSARMAATPVAGAGLSPMVMAFLLSLLVPLYFSVGPVSMVTHRVVLLAVVGPLLVRLLSGQAGPLRATDGLILAYLVWSALAMAVNNPSRVILFSGSVSLEVLGGYLLGRVCIRNIEQLRALARFIGGMLLLTMPLAIYETLTSASFLLDLYGKLPVPTVPQPPSAGRLGFERVQLTFPTAIHYGIFATSAFSLLLVSHQQVWSMSRRMIVGSLIAACTFMSLSSGALLPLVLQLGFIIWATALRTVATRWKILFALAVAMYVLLDLLSDRSPIMVIISYLTLNPSTAYFRTLIFNFGSDNVWARPVFGMGLNDWVRPSWMNNASVDNYWLLVAMRYGLPALVFLAAAWLTQIWQVARRPFAPDSMLTHARRAWLFMITAMIFALVTVDVWGGVMTLLFLLFGSGAWLMDAEDTASAAAPAPVARTARRATHRRGGDPDPPVHDPPPPNAPTRRRTVSYSRSPEQRRRRYSTK